jgi:hypothetical protein
MKKSYIKIYGPPIEKAFVALENLAKNLPKISKGAISSTMITGGEVVMGDYDFVFEWGEEPTEESLRLLIFNIDEVLSDLGCRYTIATK